MAPHRTLTGVTFTDEKPPQSPTSPISDAETLGGDAIIEIGDDSHSKIRSSSRSSVSDGETAQPQDEKERPNFLRRITGSFKSVPEPEDEDERPKFLRRITGSFRSVPEPEDVLENKTRKLDNTPNGFPRLAAFQSSEANFSLYRSFSYLHSRVLLDLQDEITCLEKELDEIDWDDHEEDPDRLRSREIDVDKARVDVNVRTRRVILHEIREKLMQYDEVLIKARTLESFQKPSDRNYRSVRRYHHNTKPLMDSEMDAIRSKEDIVSLHNGREWATFDGGVETLIGQADRLLQKIFRTHRPPLQKYFRTPELQEKTENAFISFYSSERIDKLVNILITFVIFILLVIPVLTMYHLTSTSTLIGEEVISHDTGSSTTTINVNSRDTFNAVGVLVIFTLLFSAAMSLVTKAARHELFAASAAYCAILVVFIGNFTGPGN